jgi:hypothetical protein
MNHMLRHMLILICELYDNGKGNKAIDYDMILYVPRLKICTNGTILHDDVIVNVHEDDVVVFSVNEDGMHYIQKINSTIPQLFAVLIDIRSALKIQFPNIIMYNDPLHFDGIGNKLHTYNLLKHLPYVPKYSQYPCDTWNTYPCIVSASRASGGRFRHVCNDSSELKTRGTKIQRMKGSTFIVEYIDSYIPQIECYHNLRLMIINNTLVDWFFRPSDNWNIHTRSQNMEKLLIADTWFAHWYSEHTVVVTSFIADMYNVLGNGAYAYDVIIKDDKIVLCEVGYKFWDDTVAKLIPLNKPTNDIVSYKANVKSLLLNNEKIDNTVALHM